MQLMKVHDAADAFRIGACTHQAVASAQVDGETVAVARSLAGHAGLDAAATEALAVRMEKASLRVHRAKDKARPFRSGGGGGRGARATIARRMKSPGRPALIAPGSSSRGTARAR